MRRYCARWTAAEAILAFAWGALATGLLADALSRESIGSGLLSAFSAWQMSHVWSAVHGREPLVAATRRSP